MRETGFYHCFPRFCHKETDDRQIPAGLAILRSIAAHGLLLVPEVPRVANMDPILQHRLCFTALNETDLLGHASKFGRFALEYDYENMCRLGAIPAFYLPIHPGIATADYRNAGRDLLGNLRKLEFLLRDLKDHTEPWVECFKKFAAERSLNDIHALHWIPNAVQNLFYPTDKNPGQLDYYEQREWKIVPNFLRPNEDGKLVQDLASPTCTQCCELLGINRDFFEGNIGQWGRRVDHCRFFKAMNGKPVVEMARRIIAPSSALPEIERIFDGKLSAVSWESIIPDASNGPTAGNSAGR